MARDITLEKIKIKLFSFEIPGLGRLLVLANSLEEAVESAQNYFHTGLSISNMKQFAKYLPTERTIEYLTGAVIGEDGVIRSQNQLKKEYEQMLIDCIDE